MLKKSILPLLCLATSLCCVANSYANVALLPILIGHQLNELGNSERIIVPDSNETGQYEISWYTNKSNLDYVVQEKSALHDWQEIYSGTNLKTSITKSESGRFQYRFQSCALDICSAFIESNYIDVFVPETITPNPPAQPTLLQTGNSVVINWQATEQSSSYKLEASFNAGEWQDITEDKTDISATSLQLNNLAAGTWLFRIVACNSTCVMSESTEQVIITETTSELYPAQPTTSSTEQTMVVNWQFMPDEGQYTYKAEASLNEQGWQDMTSAITFINANRFELRDLASGEWRVRMVACTEICFYSPSSIPIWVGKILPETPATPTGTVNDSTLIVDWSFVNGNPSYKVESSFNGGEWQDVTTQITFIDANKFELRNLAAGEWQVRMVACLEGCSYSLPSTSVWIGGIAPDTPAMPVTFANANTLVVDWSFVSGDPTYKVESRINGSAWQKVTSTTFINANRFELRDLIAGEWQVRMIACIEACAYSEPSTPVTIGAVIPDKPSPPTATVEKEFIIINWSPVAFADSYKLEMSLNNGPWLDISNDLLLFASNKNSKTYQNIFDGASRSYRVSACNVAGCSDFSGSSSALLTEAVSQPVTTVNLNTLVVDWEFVSGEPTYRAETSFNGGIWQQATTTFVNANRFELRDLAAGEWQVRMVACFQECFYSKASEPALIESTNNPPTIIGEPNTTAPAEQPYIFSPIAEDLDGDTLSFSLTK